MLCIVQPVRDRRGNGVFRGLLILTSILIICVVIVIKWVEVR
jgi:hypothetical protein